MAGMQRGVKIAAAILGVSVVAAAGVLVGANLADDDPSTVDSPPSTTADASTTTEREAPTSTAPLEDVDDPGAVAVWPDASTSQRFDDPAAAARSFAVQLAGFPDDTIVGDFRAGDARSGEVEVRATERGPVTTVLVRQLGDDGSWWVIGASTPNIVLSAPSPGATVSSTLEVTGRARAFEGTVEVELRADGQLEPIGGGFATGGSDAMSPFSVEIEFSTDADTGVLMVVSRSAEDGAVAEATVVRVRFG